MREKLISQWSNRHQKLALIYITSPHHLAPKESKLLLFQNTIIIMLQLLIKGWREGSIPLWLTDRCKFIAIFHVPYLDLIDIWIIHCRRLIRKPGPHNSRGVVETLKWWRQSGFALKKLSSMLWSLIYLFFLNQKTYILGIAECKRARPSVTWSWQLTIGLLRPM